MKLSFQCLLLCLLPLGVLVSCKTEESPEAVSYEEAELTEEQKDSLLLDISSHLFPNPSDSNELELNTLVQYAMDHHIAIHHDPRGYYYAVAGGDLGRPVNWKDRVSVHYRGVLPNGTEFDSSYKRNKPFEFVVGAMIPGFNFGMMHTYEGSKAWFLLPSKFGYGKQGFGRKIPPNSPLIFEIDQIKIAEKNKP